MRCAGWLWALLATAAAQTVGFESEYSQAGAPLNVTEDAGTVLVPVFLSAASGSAVTVDFAVLAGAEAPAATADVDFTASTGTLTFPAGTLGPQNVSVFVLDDGDFEDPDERFQVELSSPSGATLAAEQDTAYLRIVDDGDAGVVKFASYSYQVVEDAGSVVLTLTREGGTSGEIRVDYEDADVGSAVPGAHYSSLRTRDAGTPLSEASENTITFADGESEQTLTVLVVDDSHYDFGTVYDAADPFVLVSTSALSFVIRLTNSQPLRSSDPSLPAALLEERDWSNGNLSYGLGQETATQLIILDDGDAGEIAFTAATYYVREDTLTFDISLTRTGGTSTSLFVDATVEVLATDLLGFQNATRDFDFTFCSSVDCVVFFENGVTEASITLGLVNDDAYELPDEIVELYLNDPQGGLTLGAIDETQVVIVDDRDAGTFSFSKVEFTMFEGSTYGTVTVTRSGLAIATDTHSSAANTYASGSVSVDISTWGGYATDHDVAADAGCSDTIPCWAVAGQDYEPVDNNTLYFADGEDVKTFQISMISDEVFEAPDEVFRVVLSNCEGGAHIGYNAEHPDSWDDAINLALEPDADAVPNYVTAVGTIIDNQDPAVVIMRSSTAVAESTVVDTYAIYLNSEPDDLVTVSVSSAGNWSDEISLEPTSLTFSASNWGSPQTIVVAAVDDEWAEESEVHVVYHEVASTDANYNGDGATWGRGIFRDNAYYGYDWASSDGVIAAPHPEWHAVTVRDNDEAGAQIEPDLAWRFAVETPQSSLAVRDNGVTANYTVSLLSQPESGNATYLEVTTDNDCLSVTASSDRLPTQVTLSADGCGAGVVLVEHALSDGSPVWPSSLFVRTFPEAAVDVLQSTVAPQENGDNDTYALLLGAEPMHVDWPASETATTWTLDVYPTADVTAFEEGGSEEDGELLVAMNGTDSSGVWADRKLALLTFDLAAADIEGATGAPRTALALLRLYRTGGGENAGMGGIRIGARVSNTTATAANNNHNVTSDDFDNGEYEAVVSVPLDGEYDESLNQYVAADAGWLELDLTEQINSFASSSSVTVTVFAITTADWLADFSDQVSFASLESGSEAEAPHLRILASGSANVALYGEAAQSSSSDGTTAAINAIDGVIAPTEATGYAMTLVATSNPWWHLDLGSMRSVAAINIWIRATYVDDEEDFTLWLLLSDSDSLSGLSLSNAQSRSVVAYEFAVDRASSETVGYYEVFPLRWAAADSVDEFSDEAFVAGTAGHFGAKAIEAKFVYLRVEGRASVHLAEVEVLQPAPAAVTVSAASYLPSPSALSLRNQLALEPSQECNALLQCRTVLTFTAGNWADAQTVTITALDDDVATGDRDVGITHEAGGGDADFGSVAGVLATVAEDDVVGVTVSSNSVVVEEGAHSIAGAPAYTVEETVEPEAWGCYPETSGCSSYWLSPLLSVADFSGGKAWIRVSFGEATEVVQLDLYKSANQGSSGVKQFTLKSASSMSNSASRWSTVSNGGARQVPWGSTATGSWYSYKNLGFNDVALMLVVDEVYELAGETLVEEPMVAISKLRFTAKVPLEYEYAEMPVDSTKLSRTHSYGESASYQVALQSEPVEDVVVVLSVGDDGYITAWDAGNSSQGSAFAEPVVTATYLDGDVWSVQQPVLVFNASSWAVPQTVTVSAVDDNAQTGNRESTVTHSLVSGDAGATVQSHAFSSGALQLVETALASSLRYDSAADAVFEPENVVQVDLTEDDRAGVTLSASSVDAVEGEDLHAFSVLLDAQPTDAVTVAVEVSGAGLQVSPSQVVFESRLWHQPKTVAVTVSDDAVFSGSDSLRRTYSSLIARADTELVSLAVTSADETFDASPLGENEPGGNGVVYVAQQGVVVTVVDNDGGCDAEYECANGGECDSAAHTCSCPEGYGGYDCSSECRALASCAFSRVFLLATGEIDSFDVEPWIQALATHVGVGDEEEALYAWSYYDHTCLFSNRQACVAVEVDVVDSALAGAHERLREAILDAEADGELAGDPLRVQYAVQLDTLTPVLTANYLAWTLAGGFLLNIASIVLWRFKIVRDKVLGAKNYVYTRVWHDAADEEVSSAGSSDNIDLEPPAASPSGTSAGAGPPKGAVNYNARRTSLSRGILAPPPL